MVNTIWKENFLIMCSKLCLTPGILGILLNYYSFVGTTHYRLCGAPHNVCNDNGIAENLPLNRMLGDYDIIHGAFFVCGLTRDDFTDLTPQQMKHYEEMYHDPQLFFLLGKTLCVEHTTPEEYARVMAPPPKTKESPER